MDTNKFRGRSIGTQLLRLAVLSVLSVALTIPAIGMLMQFDEDLDPWAEKDTAAIVRIEVAGPRRDIGTGFIVRGTDAYYVITATHVLFKTPPLNSGSCTAFSAKLVQGDIRGPLLGHATCAVNLGRDISLIKLRDKADGYPVLTLTSRAPRRRDRVFIAGFPRADKLDTARYGVVSIPETEGGHTATTLLTMEGFSGGPYLSEDGNVIGVHLAGVNNRGGFAHFMSIATMREQLAPIVGNIPDHPLQRTAPGSLANSVSRNATLGTALAFQYMLPSNRISAWQTLTGRNPTSDERRFLEGLAYVAVPERDRQIVPVNLAAQTASREELSVNLKAAAALASVACADSEMTIKDAIIDCGATSTFTASPNAGGRNVPILLVFHSTFTPNLSSTLRVFFDPKLGVAPHILIDRDGTFRQLVPFNRAAAHAGFHSTWGNLSALNNASIGIELINHGSLRRDEHGKFYDYSGRLIPSSEVDAVSAKDKTVYWHKYTPEQIATTLTISRKLKAAYPIQAAVGHCHILKTKQDPGPGFPMDMVSREVLGQPASACSIN